MLESTLALFGIRDLLVRRYGYRLDVTVHDILRGKDAYIMNGDIKAVSVS